VNEEPAKVSIVIVNWNTRDLILRCLGHLLQTQPGEILDIWVVDNGSQDGSTEAIRKAFPRVQLIANAQNQGFARAANQALARCRGRYMLLLNTDCFPQEGAIQALVKSMQADPRAGIAGGALLHSDGRPQHAFGAAPTLASELLHRGLLQALLPGRFPSKRHPPKTTTEVEAVLGAFLLVRREAWWQVGGLDEGYFLFFEETDWCLRMRRAGWKVLHVPTAVALHLQGQSARRNLEGARVEYHRSRYRFFALHRGALSLRVLKVGLFLRCLMNWVSSGAMGSLAWDRRDRWQRRHRVDRTVLCWHLRGCPEGWGLPASRQGPGVS
jgi:GT2 family glycosyltransferase